MCAEAERCSFLGSTRNEPALANCRISFKAFPITFKVTKNQKHFIRTKDSEKGKNLVSNKRLKKEKEKNCKVEFH
jgi:hypothetical protein